MSIKIARGRTDTIIDEIKNALASFETDHPKAEIDLYRQNTASVRIRIIDPDFAGMSRSERNDYVWNYFDDLTEDAQGDISMLVLLTPPEVKKDFANVEFEDPVSSRL